MQYVSSPYIPMNLPSPAYYQHTYPGQATKHTGDMRVPSSKKGMESREYKEFETAHDSYLGVASLNILLLIAVVSIFTHLLLVVSGQEEFNTSTIIDVLNGPLMLIVIAGLAGVGLVFGHMGVSDNLYYSLYIPFGLLVIGVGLWSILDEAEVNIFKVEGFSGVSEFAPETMMWLGIAVVVGLASIAQWLNGNYRLDSMGGSGMATFVLILTTMLFTYGMSRIFALVLKTMDFAKMDENSPLYLTTYISSSIGMLVLVIAGFKFLDTALHFVGGHLGSIFSPPTGIGASKAIIETKRVYQLGLYTVIFLSSALMWRRRNGLKMDEENDGLKLKSSWTGVVFMFLMVPLLAIISEAMKEWFDTYSPLYDLVRAIVFSGLLIFVGIGYIPWNFVTLGLAGLVALYMFMKHIDVYENYDKPLATLFFAVAFTLGRMYFRSADMKNSSMRWINWIMYLVGPAFGFLLLSLADFQYSTYSQHMARIYFGFVVVYSMSLTFIDTDKKMFMRDSPFYDMVPENEAASLAIDAIILMACLMVVTAVWAVIAPKRFIKGSEVSTIRIPGSSIKFRVNILTMIYYAAIGAACAYMYVNIRHDRALSSFARNSQLRAEEWYTKIRKDSLK